MPSIDAFRLPPDDSAAAKSAQVILVPVPNGFAHEEVLQQLCAVLIPILQSGVISERELVKRIIRHHPAQEGV